MDNSASDSRPARDGELPDENRLDWLRQEGKLIKLLHIADVHLDAPFLWLGTRGREQRAQLKETFRKVVDLALQERVDAFLVAGDLFDSNWPSEDSIDLVLTQFARLPMPIVLLPGTHDCFDASSIYRKVNFDRTGDGHVLLFDDAHPAFDIGPLLTVHGKANVTKSSPFSPLTDLRVNRSARYNVTLAHGSLAMPGTERDFPVAREEIANSGFDYIALGHWHSYRDCSSGSVKAFYSGALELLERGEQGGVLLVELDDKETRVNRRLLARRRYEKLSVQMDQVASVEEIREEIRRKRDQELVLEVQLRGLKNLTLVVEPEKLVEEFYDQFFALSLDDQSHPSLSQEAIDALPEKTIIGHFARQMAAVLAGAPSDEAKTTTESALQLGLALLQGRKILQ